MYLRNKIILILILTSEIHTHKQNLWKEHLYPHLDHRPNTHILWKTIHGISNRAPTSTFNTSIIFNNKITTTPKNITNCFTKQFTNTVKHAARQTDPLTERHRKYKDITLHSLLQTLRVWSTPAKSHTICSPMANERCQQSLSPALPTVEGKPSLVSAFSEEEYRKGIAVVKNNKAAGIDDILVEQLKHLGPKAHKWLHTMLNTCFIENKIPKIWRQSKIIAILKPGKDYRPISLLCHTYKLYERLILNRVSPLLEQHQIREQAGFRLGKSCPSQLHNLTQHIEDGYHGGMITGATFVDPSTVYGTVNHMILTQKLYNTTQDSQLCRVFQNMLSNRRFYVELNNERSRWRRQKNGLPQGSVLSLILFNIYTNDQPFHDGTRNFIYADDLCVTAQYSSFTEVETTIGDALEELTQYYRSNSLRANPDKTQVTAFHLSTEEHRGQSITKSRMEQDKTGEYPTPEVPRCYS